MSNDIISFNKNEALRYFRAQPGDVQAEAAIDSAYEKLRKESNPTHPKYIFKGLEAEMGRPKVYDGENYTSYPAQYEQMRIHLEKTSEIQLFIFNIGKIFNSRTDSQFNFHKFKEELGMSFADVLSGFDDLVICMDEAHHYYAPASMKAINYLKPVLGLEFTATPKVPTAIENNTLEIFFFSVLLPLSFAFLGASFVVSITSGFLYKIKSA